MYNVAALLDPDLPTTVAGLAKLGMSEPEVLAELRRLASAGEAELIGDEWFRRYPKWEVEADKPAKSKPVKVVKELQGSLFNEH
jgi:hypothetical protein